MKFRTEFEAIKASFSLDPRKPVVLMGSCFSQNIAAKMEAHQWSAILPSGTLYNPISLYLALDLFLDDQNGLQRFRDSLFEFNGVWNSNKFDSSFSSLDKEDCIQEFLQRREQFIKTLEAGEVLIVTFGTSIVYYSAQEQMPVGNCHKLPSELFYTKRMTPAEIESLWSRMIKRLQNRFPEIKIIFTVSPVRHLKNGFTGNALSKAVLLLGVEEILNKNADSYYFPAYEILNDDLRDYRFYASDLAHPSEEAIEYIWEKFKDTFINNEGKKILDEGARKVKAKSHRPKTGALGKELTRKGQQP